MKTPILNKPSTLFRSGIARGIVSKDEPAITRDGGKFGAGLIRRMSVITTGEAMGHDLWIDHEMLSQVADAINSSEEGVKARFTHPGLSGDGLGKLTARVFDAVVEGDRVLADAHMLESAHKTPDGDLAGYVMDLAEEAPDAFGASISFLHDYDDEDEFMAKNTGKDGRFISPDENNANNYPHARIKKLRAVDVVDTPAANPGGLFHAGPFELLENCEAMLDYVFGVTESVPDANFGVDSSRLKGFVARWASNRGFSIKKETNMSSVDPAAETKEAETKPVELLADNTATPPAAAPQSTAPPVLSSPATEASAVPAAIPAQLSATDPVIEKTKADYQSEFRLGLKRYTELFGAEKGAKWFSDGKPLDECRDQHAKDLDAINKDLAVKLAAARTGMGEDAPLSGTPGSKDAIPSRLELACGPNLAKFAASVDAQAARLKPCSN